MITEDRFREIMSGYSGKWVGDNVFQGLVIISKYTNNIVVAAEHDMIYSESIEKLIKNGITEEDVKNLRRLNWMLENGNQLASYV